MSDKFETHRKVFGQFLKDAYFQAYHHIEPEVEALFDEVVEKIFGKARQDKPEEVNDGTAGSE